MPLGPFGEVVGTTGTLEALGPDAANYKSKVIAPRNPKLVKGEDGDNKMTPSKFMFDMQMNTEQKLANTHVMHIPRKIELLDMADTSLQKVPRLVKVTQADSPYFKIISPHDVGHKVGPGLPTTFKIQFRPEEKKDYSHELVCITEREKFIVPVKAIGARAILDFPDNIHFPAGPVKNTHTKTLLVRNIGNNEAKFTLSAEKPFSVTPEIGTLPVNESMQVTVEFTPQKAGDHNSELVLHYDTGEDVLISLYGGAQDANVRLDKNSIRIENTYISMANQRTVIIHNRSDVIAHFRWSQFATAEEEEQQKMLMTSRLSIEENADTDNFLKECIQDPTLRDKLSILSRTFKNRRRMVDDDKMLFSDDVIKVEPVEGDVWPNSTFEINVIFKPREAETYTKTAFCDITGRESRLPLRIRGDGIGPNVQFSFDNLDMGNIFIGSKHVYEIVLVNKGDIDAIYSVMPKKSIFGPCFSFNPAEGIVMPGGHQAIQISFTSPYLGDFLEEFSFQVDGQPETLKVTFMGSVIGPTFQFDTPMLKFGTVSYGFLNTQTCMLQNTSLVPMKFHIRVPGDGITDSMCSTSDLETGREGGSPTPPVGVGPPKEFEIVPSTGTLQPQSDMKIKVNFTSNTVKKYEMALVVDVENVGEEILQLPLTAKCIVPPVTVLSPILDYGRCFLRHPYEHNVKLHNDTDLPARYDLVKQEITEDTSIVYRSPKAKGIVEPHSVYEVPLVIEAQMLEEQDMVAHFAIFGSQDPPLPVHISCIGEGPVVHITPGQLDWGIVPVLTSIPQTITLSNESLIPARFTANMVRPRSAFSVDPVEAEIPAEKSLDIKVIAHLDDAVRFQDKLQLNFIESQVRYIPLVGYGQGTTITADPALTPQLDLGPNFSNRPLKKTFKLTNKGRRHQQLIWSMDGFGPVGKARKELAAYNPLDMKYKNVPPPALPPRPIFSVNPNRIDLAPGATCDLNIDGFVDSPQFVRERILCHAIIGRQGGKELIMRVDVSADFISPLLEFSAKSVYFRFDKRPDDDLSMMTRELKMTNVSTLPLTTVLQLKKPFQIILDDRSEVSETEVHLEIGQEYTLTIQFDPAYKEDLHIRTIDEVLHVNYKEHPHVDYIALRGEVYFPNLDFEKSVIDFDCILNDTEVTRYINITNNSPMDVKYKWSFLVGEEPCVVVKHPPKPEPQLDVVEEEADEEEAEEVEEEEAEPEQQVELVIEEEAADTEKVEEEEKAEVEPTKIIVTEGTEDMIKPASEIVDDNKLSDRQSPSRTGSPSVMEEEHVEKGQLEQEDMTEEGVEKSEVDPMRLSIASLRDAVQDEDPLKSNRALSRLLEMDRDDATPIGVEEVFDILPLYGTLRPGDTEQVTMTFYGHADIDGEVKAICEVEGGPTYEVILRGQASLVEYKFDNKEIDFGKQVGFEFTGVGMDPAAAKKPRPGEPIMVPHAGYIKPGEEQTLTVKYMPGVPEDFEKRFTIQVAHFEPEVITIKGSGVFPRISLDLPRNSDTEGHYTSLANTARSNLLQGGSTLQVTKATTERPASTAPSTHRPPYHIIQGDACMPSELDVQMEVEPSPPESNESRESKDSKDSKAKRRPKIKPKLPEYLLDFGHVVLGTVRTHVVRATNTGFFPVSLHVEKDNIHHYGFHVELDRIKNLPGHPENETVDFTVSFDPRGANLQLGPVETLVPINTTRLEFSDVKCGECKVITVQLYNQQQVKCEWNSLPSEKELKKADKHVPMHLRRKNKQDKGKPRHFEIMPPTGTLMPGQRLNVQVKFMPTEERYYEQRIPIRIYQSSQRILLLCRGQGLEPRLEFDRNLVEFGPILPHSAGDEQDIVVRNPCNFPIEFYNLEFDSSYLEEEKVLRLMKGYDEYNTILLPPRNPGEKLPPELVEFYDEQMKKLEESERARREAEEAALAAKREMEEKEGEGESEGSKEQDDSEVKTDAAFGTNASRAPSQAGTVEPLDTEDRLKKEELDEAQESASSIGVGELEITPVSAAIARHLGKTATAVALAKKYEAAILTIDQVVLDAISGGNTPAGLRAREMCQEAARRRAEELKLHEGEEPEKKTGGLSVEAVTAHTQGTTGTHGVSAAPSVVSNRKTSVVSDVKGGKDKHSMAGKTGINASSIEGGTGSQVPSSPPPLMAPIARRLSVSASVAGEEGLMSCVLPEDLLVEILSERLQLNDCHRGVVFDGLETLFAQNLFIAVHAILRSLNNRRFIYFINLKLDYSVLKEQEKKAEEERERLEREREEEERQRLEEMSEDEYDALTDADKAEVDKKRLEIKKERIRKEREEREERERKQREADELERLRLEEEKASKKGKKKQTDKKEEPSKDGKKSTVPGKPQSAMDSRVQQSRGGPKHDGDHSSKTGANTERPESHHTEKSDTQDDGKKAKSKGKEGGKKDEKGGKTKEGKELSEPPIEEPPPPLKESEILLMQRFRTVEHANKDICELIEFWDRTTLSPKRPPTPSEKSEEDAAHHPPSGKKGKGGKGDKHDKEKEKEKEKQKQIEAEKAAKEAAEKAALQQGDGENADGEISFEIEGPKEKEEDGVGIPLILVDCADKSITPFDKVLDTNRLPSMEEVMDGLGLGPKGPPIPPAAAFAVVPYPVKRRAPPVSEFGGRYVFIASSPDDPNIGVPDTQLTEPEEEKSVTPDKGKEEYTTPTKGKGAKGAKEEKKDDKKERKKSAEKSRGGGGKAASRRNSMQVPSPPPGATTPVSDIDVLSTTGEGLAVGEPKTPKLSIFRWIIPANAEVVLRLRFQSEELGQFDQTLNFEIVGTRRRYQLYCRGICAFPSISREPRIVFPSRKKSKKTDEIVHKKYILATETFEFGPLTPGKSRADMKSGRFPENMEKITVSNTSPLEADISFCYLNDSKGDTFLLDPPTMILKPGESQPLTIWAYPRSQGHYDDSIVCCIRENPEPVVFKVCCDAFLPALELDKKQFHFDSVLLHRKDTKTIYLRNTTQLPVKWKLTGWENLGDDFTVAADSGVVDPLSEYPLHAYFRAMKPVTTTKKMIRLEVSDMQDILGGIHNESIQVIAEAYDVALDVSFQKGNDGGLDFGTVKVGSEEKTQCQLKNKGKFEIQYNFKFDNVDPSIRVEDLFTVSPKQMTLNPNERPQPVTVSFKSNKEVHIKDQPILKVEVIEPKLGDGGEVIACIPIRVSAEAEFAKYSISPLSDINFGSVLVNNKKTKTFTIFNTGKHEFKYQITLMQKDKDHHGKAATRPPVKDNKRSRSRDGSSSGKSVAKPKKTDSVRQEGAGQSRLQFKTFTLSPAFGMIYINQSQVITVEYNAESQGRFDEGQATMDGGVYGEDEKKFVFNNVIIGRKAKARFKISNINKVPCDIALSVKPIVSKGTARQQQEIFEVEPTRAQILNHSHVYATVTFTPSSMQTFNAIFEAAIEGVPTNQAKTRNLTFEISGEGNLPRISIMKPLIRNKRGQALLLFKRNLVGRTETLPIVLVNDGTLPSKVDIDMLDPDKVFQIKPVGDTQAVMDDESDTRRPHTASVIVNVGEKAMFDVTFKPGGIQRSQAHLHLTVIDNQFEDSVIQLVGEGYEDDITLDNIHSVEEAIEIDMEEGNMAEDDITAAKPNLIRFGDCFINEPRTLSFTMTNHSKTDTVRFAWPDHPQLKFSPQIGHLHPNTAKDMTVTFKAEAPKSFTESPVNCKIVKITFDKPADKVADWDDRIRTVKWIDIPTSPQPSSDGTNKAPLSSRPAKKKVIETEPEPNHTEQSESQRNMELLVTASADYCKYECKTEAVHFKDTLMFQSRMYEFSISNEGSIKMDYNWQVVMENFQPMMTRAVTFMSEAERPESRIELADSNYVPFTIEPEFGSIARGKKQKFVVRFSPLDVNEYEARLVCTISNLEKSQQGPVVGLKAKSLMPYCHFELEDSNYIGGARRNPEMRGPHGAPPGSTLDPNTRVIEFSCIGVGVKNVKTFAIVNPTNQPYSFEWVCEDEEDPKVVPSFKCLTPRGHIKSGKKFQVSFEYTSNELDIVESFWKFFIPEQNISVPFLLVGQAREPDISMDRSHMNFKALLIGHEAIETVYLLNNEDQPFFFQFDEDSCHSAGFSAHLGVNPMSATVPARSKIPIELYFTPNSDKEVNFNLTCQVRRKVLPVTLNVKAEGYSMNCSLQCEDSQGNKLEFVDNGPQYHQVEVNEKQIRNLTIMNTGKFNFDYQWELHMSSKKKEMVAIEPMSGSVLNGDKQNCRLTFCPPCRTTLKDTELVLSVAHGPTYNIGLEGLGVTPGLHFSFQSYNFGNCFIIRAGMPASSKVLRLTNKDKKEISVECLYPNNTYLSHTFESGRCIAPGDYYDVTFTFYPREAKKYSETITFEVNGLSRQSVQINGTGTEMKIEVADPKHKILNLGAQVVHNMVKKYIPIVNNSPAAISFNLALTPITPALQATGALSISPTNTITLEPKGGTCKVEVVFAPKCRIPQFTEEVLLECAGLYQPLFVIQGQCLGMEISLDTTAIPFPTNVVEGASITRKIVMSNSGDMNAKFRWDIRKFRPDFSINPVEGYITPGMDVTFEVTFEPKKVQNDIRYDNLRCFLEGGPHPPVTLTLTGGCVNPTPSKDIHVPTFQVPVRKSETKPINIANKSNAVWNLKPVIEGDFFSGPLTFTIEPQQTKGYPITYRPLTMVAEGQKEKHTGSIFFALPDGQAIFLSLSGTTEPPKMNGEGPIKRDVPCKVPYTELLLVENWLKKPQRFSVKWEPVKQDMKLDIGTEVKGMSYIDVPASGKKDFKLNFFAHKDGLTQLRVTFTNDKTGEYQFYEVHFRAYKGGPMETIELTTPVRQSVSHTITIDNNLRQATSFTVTCSVPEIQMPNQFNVPAMSKYPFTFDYLPLKVGEVTGHIDLNSNELGTYVYDLSLKATPAGPEKALYFRTCLGQNQIQVAKFLNFAKQAKADYTCKVDNSDFHTEKTVAAAPGSHGGTEVALDVTFEPSKLGEQRAMLTISSPQGGEYVFPLFGTCIPPKPQGPYIVKTGSTTTIPFRNVFHSQTEFLFQVDNPAFHLTKQSENIKHRKEYKIVVGFDGNDSGTKAGVMGKLIVTCTKSVGGSNVQWVYYLKGVTV
ncbi:hypothetical protein FSP39_003318 [Pinctada imbricata]|uniref:Hydrocephalus-inducing protein n=1 Tax=Pinctada imbricata TaxID=66713 RepID=A0AA89BWR5_PINIB|nr:hypothetical protein FSP39_003318 [Pinctada imbricata]